MKGEFDSPSKPASETYRENWERVYQRHSPTKSEPTISERIDREVAPVAACSQYPNGCPILESNEAH